MIAGKPQSFVSWILVLCCWRIYIFERSAMYPRCVESMVRYLRIGEDIVSHSHAEKP